MLALFLIPPFLVAFVGSQWTSPNVDSEWYRELSKPSWQPPSWVFAPVWTTLYFLMAVAAWRVWLSARDVAVLALPLGLWAVQLVFNLGWTYAFFEQRSPISGLFVIVALWLLVAATIAAFFVRSRLAAGLLLPYIAWVTFATALNISIWQMN